MKRRSDTPAPSRSNSRSAKRNRFALRGCYGGIAFFLLFSACSSLPPSHRSIPSGEENTPAIRYSIIFIIHGDGDYLYHDSSGKALRADREALRRATMVALRNPRAEVFIFHEKPTRRALLLFLRPDGEMFYYRNGTLRDRESYHRSRGSFRFDPELRLYRRFRAPKQAELRMALYFGHEIPELNGAGYDASAPSRTFTVNDLARGIQGFAVDSGKFDLLALSTCFGGTPHTIASLAPYARYIIASPENLHLSYFDLGILEHLENNNSIRDRHVSLLSNEFARASFLRLSGEVQTAVTVAVYDVDRVQSYLNAVTGFYRTALYSLRKEPISSLEHGDCARDSMYVRPGMGEGVELFYRPPQFGRSRNATLHSGWECWRKRE